MTVADRIADFLASHGCSHAYGLVTDESRPLMDAISKRMTLITMRNEMTCVLGAMQHYRVTGRIAPCLIPGGENAMAGVTQAQIEGVPLLVISSNEHSGFNAIAVADPITKAAMRADNALGASFTLDGLYKLALASPQGPVWFYLPADIAVMDQIEEFN